MEVINIMFFTTIFILLPLILWAIWSREIEIEEELIKKYEEEVYQFRRIK